MPLATIHLLALRRGSVLHDLIGHIRDSQARVLTIAKPIRWIVLPEKIDTQKLLSYTAEADASTARGTGNTDQKWDLLLILVDDVSSRDLIHGILERGVRSEQDSHRHRYTVSEHYTLTAGIPNRLIRDFDRHNHELLHPHPHSHSDTTSPSLTSSPSLSPSLSSATTGLNRSEPPDGPIIKPTSQSLALSPELKSWIEGFYNPSPKSGTHSHSNDKQEHREATAPGYSSRSSSSSGSTVNPPLRSEEKLSDATRRGAVSMLNLLAFKPGRKDEYLKYGRAFSEDIGAKRGGQAKLVGNVVGERTQKGEPPDSPTRWDEFALAHYPSIAHFADMLGSRDYQAVNERFRVPSLEDTCILFTSEIEIECVREWNSDPKSGQDLRDDPSSDKPQKGLTESSRSRKASKL